MIRLTTLGGLDLRNPDGAEARSVVSQPKRVALLAYLAVARPLGFHRRDTLLGLFWPELEESRARHALNQAVYGLRSSLGAAAISSRGEEIGVDATEIWCDARAFEDALDGKDLETALDLYGGDLLPGLFIPGSNGFEQWLDGERRRLRDRATGAAWSLAEQLEATGDVPRSVELARHAMRLAPTDETGLRRLVELLDRSGDRAGAVEAYARFADLLENELELTPSPETQRLVDEVRARSVTTTVRAASGPAPDARNPDTDSPETAPDEARVEHTEPPSRPARTAPQRRISVAWLALFPILAVLAAVTIVQGTRAPARGVEDPRRSFALMPFDVSSGDPAWDWLATGAPSLLGIDLGGWEEIRVADRRNIAAIAADRGIRPEEATLDEALDIARAAGIGTLVIGDIVEQAGRLDILVRAYDTGSGNELVQAEQSIATGTEDLRPAFDRIAARLLDLGESPEIGPDVRAATTGSLDAFREYSAGMDHLYEWRLDAAVERFERAIGLDSTFARAYHRLAMTEAWRGGAPPARIQSLTRAAVEHGEDLPPRERKHVLAFHALRHGELEVARELYAELTAADPGDAEAWFHRGDVDYHDEALVRDAGGRFVPRANLNTALVGFERAVEIDPRFHLGYGHLFEMLEYLQPMEGFDAFLLPEDERVEGEDPYVYLYPAWRDSAFYVVLDPETRSETVSRLADDSITAVLRSRGIDAARRWANAAPDETRPWVALRDLYVKTRALSPALAAHRRLLDVAADTSVADRLILGALLLAAGAPDSAIVQTERALEQGNVFFHESLSLSVLLGTGQVDRALEVAFPREYSGDEWIPTPNGRFMTTEWRPAFARIRLLGVAGALRPELETELDALWSDWSSRLTPEDLELLVCGRFQVLAPALMLLDPRDARRWLGALDPPLSFPQCQVGHPALLSWARVRSDSLAQAERSFERASRALELQRTRRPFDLFLLASVAESLGRPERALQLLTEFDRSRLWELYAPGITPGYNRALATRSQLIRARSHEALGHEEQALEHYRTFLEAWKSADRDLQRLADDARTALERLGSLP